MSIILVIMDLRNFFISMLSPVDYAWLNLSNNIKNFQQQFEKKTFVTMQN